MRNFMLNGFTKTAMAAVATVGLMGSPVLAEGDSNTGNVSVSGGISAGTAYIFRGIVQQDQGLVLQPELFVGFALCEQATLHTGVWNSVHSGVGSGEDSGWFEADWSVGVEFALSDTLSLDVSYVNLYNPDGGTTFAEELDFTLSYDDGSNPLLGDIALNPYILVAIETDDGSDGVGGDASSGSEGSYFEFGVNPEIGSLGSENSVTLTLPMTLGMNLGDYYETASGLDNDDDFGFFDIGLVASMPLDVDSAWGAWSLSAGLHYITLGDSAQRISGVFASGGESDMIYSSIALSFDY